MNSTVEYVKQQQITIALWGYIIPTDALKMITIQIHKKMETIFRVTLFIAGIINIIPSFLVILPQKISKSYGIEIPNVNYELLLRHRAVLLGIIGGLMVYSAISKKYYELSSISGLISMISFIILYFLISNGINNELRKVMVADVIATIVLIVGIAFYLLSSKNTTQ